MQKKRSNWSVLGKIVSYFKYLLRARNVIIISEQKVDHIPLSPSVQMLGLLGILGFIMWASYSTGSFMAARSVVKEKDRKIAYSKMENRRIESEFALLKRDLVNMLNHKPGQGKQVSDYTQFVLNQYKTKSLPSPHDPDAPINLGLGTLDQNIVFERIAFLERKVDQLKSDHQAMVEDIRKASGGKIKELERVIAMTGIDVSPMERRARQRQERIARDNRPNSPRGGPYQPAFISPLAEREPVLYSNLKRLSLLSEIVDAMPLERPMNHIKMTSDFGMRTDPFTRRPAMHTGIDFAGPHGAPIRATADGIVTRSGRFSAYGNAVDIDHGMGLSTRYGHLSHMTVKKGEKVRKGQVIGYQGSTGRSTGSHLHYEVRYHDDPIDPLKFVKAGTYVRSQQQN